MKRAIFGVLAISLGLLLKSCNTVDPPPGEKPTFALKLEDVSCTEAWIELTTTNLQLPATIILKQTNPTGDTKSQILNLNSKDSLLYIDSLLPNKNYQYQASSIENPASSNELNVTTMDTTSHNFTFKTFTFGGTAGSSTLYDVAIISPENIWCVGEIMIADTSINGYTTYNAVHWNGSQWELKRILYQGGFWVIRTIFAFSENDIWFSAFVRFDGQNFIELSIPPILIGWSINKIWGSSSNDLYVVGNNGNIARYLNGTWSRIESGTELNIQDIWGDKLPGAENFEIICIASNILQNDGREVLKIQNNGTVKLPTDGLSAYFSGLWFKPNRKYYIVGGGIHKKNNVTSSGAWYRYTPGTINNYYSVSVRGSEINDIIICGSFGEIVHFNGIRWTNYTSQTYMTDGTYTAIKLKGYMFVTVGYRGAKAIITIGRR